MKVRNTVKLVKSVKVESLPDEIFVLAESPEDARRIDRMNGELARQAKAARMKELARRGEVNEVLMPDTQTALWGELMKEQERRRIEQFSRKAE